MGGGGEACQGPERREDKDRALAWGTPGGTALGTRERLAAPRAQQAQEHRAFGTGLICRFAVMKDTASSGGLPGKGWGSLLLLADVARWPFSPLSSRVRLHG